MPRHFRLTDHAYAHRGLWSDGTPENSLAAFKKAVDAGVGAECDIHLTGDGVPIIFHDFSLKRMTGVDKAVADCDLATIQSVSLAGTDQTIPTLSDVLDAMTDLPLLVELKSRDDKDCEALALAVSNALRGYSGRVAVMSFDQNLMIRFKSHAPEILTGFLTPPGFLGNERNRQSTAATLQDHAFDYLAPHILDAPFAAADDLLRCPLASWTVSDPDLLQIATETKAAPIFEKLEPDLVRRRSIP